MNNLKNDYKKERDSLTKLSKNMESFTEDAIKDSEALYKDLKKKAKDIEKASYTLAKNEYEKTLKNISTEIEFEGFSKDADDFDMEFADAKSHELDEMEMAKKIYKRNKKDAKHIEKNEKRLLNATLIETSMECGLSKEKLKKEYKKR